MTDAILGRISRNTLENVLRVDFKGVRGCQEAAETGGKDEDRQNRGTDEQSEMFFNLAFLSGRK
jgi:hypothetical protein